MPASTPSTNSDCRTLLSDPTRRRICAILSSPDPPVSERDLAVELAARCLGVPAAEITTAQRRRQRIQLRHHQLPKLADYGLIIYDQSTETVSITADGYEALVDHPNTRQYPPATAASSSN